MSIKPYLFLLFFSCSIRYDTLCAAEGEHKQQHADVERKISADHKALQNIAEVRSAILNLDTHLTRVVNALAVARNSAAQLEQVKQRCEQDICAALAHLRLMQHHFSPITYLQAPLGGDECTKTYLDTLAIQCFAPLEKRMQVVQQELSFIQQNDVSGIQKYIWGCRAFWRGIMHMGKQQDTEMQRLKSSITNARALWASELAIRSSCMDRLSRWIKLPQWLKKSDRVVSREMSELHKTPLKNVGALLNGVAQRISNLKQQVISVNVLPDLYTVEFRVVSEIDTIFHTLLKKLSKLCVDISMGSVLIQKDILTPLDEMLKNVDEIERSLLSLSSPYVSWGLLDKDLRQALIRLRSVPFIKLRKKDTVSQALHAVAAVLPTQYTEHSRRSASPPEEVAESDNKSSVERSQSRLDGVAETVFSIPSGTVRTALNHVDVGVQAITHVVTQEIQPITEDIHDGTRALRNGLVRAGQMLRVRTAAEWLLPNDIVFPSDAFLMRYGCADLLRIMRSSPEEGSKQEESKHASQDSELDHKHSAVRVNEYEYFQRDEKSADSGARERDHQQWRMCWSEWQKHVHGNATMQHAMQARYDALWKQYQWGFHLNTSPTMLLLSERMVADSIERLQQEGEALKSRETRLVGEWMRYNKAINSIYTVSWWRKVVQPVCNLFGVRTRLSLAAQEVQEARVAIGALTQQLDVLHANLESQKAIHKAIICTARACYTEHSKLERERGNTLPSEQFPLLPLTMKLLSPYQRQVVFGAQQAASAA